MAATNSEPVRERVNFPVDEHDWDEVKLILMSMARDENTFKSICDRLTELYYVINKRKPRRLKPESISQTAFGGLKIYYDSLEDEAKEKFVQTTIPCIAKLALEAPGLIPEGGLYYSKQQEPLELRLGRRFVASIVASGFLCLFNNVDNENLPTVTFDMFFSGVRGRSQCAKLQMILNYFNRIADLEKGPEGDMVFTRIVLDDEKLLSEGALQTCDNPLVPFIVDKENTIEDAGYKVLQTDFANEFLGGGVLFMGNVQEEIRFSVCPELLSSMLFMECMAPNEAIIFRGFEQYSSYTGYGGGLGFGGDFVENPPKDDHGNILTEIVAIDAIPYAFSVGTLKQYSPELFMRDINKAYAGFLQPLTKSWPEDKIPKDEAKDEKWIFNLDPTYKRAVATGNWGCGAFGGDPQFKTMLQWIAVSYAKCPGLVYYTFKDKKVDGLQEVIDKITSEKWNVKKLFAKVVEYGAQMETDEDGLTFFEYVHENDFSAD